MNFNKTIAFTICSNNYLDKAQILKDSIRAFDNAEIYLILADSKVEIIDYDKLGFDRIVLSEELGIENLKWQLENYNIVEFNTALKSPAFEYLFKNTSANIIYYFDPDIKTYQPLLEFNKLWNNESILLTPHILSPIPLDGKSPDENLFLNHGIYNLGFLGLRRTETTRSFLKWWSERLAAKCFINLGEGYFTDQIWINLVPVFFKDVFIITHPGFNAAYWNLHERKIEKIGNKFMVNDIFELFFYHFSSFESSLTKLSNFEDSRYNFENRPEMKSLYQAYKNALEINTDANIRIEYFEGKYPITWPQKKLVNRIWLRIKNLIND